MLVHPPRTRPGRPAVSLSARHQVKHRQDLHSSGPRVTPKMKAQLQERGHEVNANGVCFRAGRTGAGKELPVIQYVAGKAGVQTGLRLPKFATPSPGIAGTPVVSGTRRGETGIAPQDRECGACISEFSENFPSSAQGRTEYRLRAWGARKRGFLRAGIRAGQVPENTGFFAGCLAPLGGGPLTFSTPRAQGLGPCPTGSPCRGLKFWGQLGWMGQGSGPHEGLPARRSRLRTADSRSPTAHQRRPPHHKPTGSPRPGCLHLAPRSALWETESSAGRGPRLPRLKNYISHKSLGRYSRGLSGVWPLRIRCLPSRKRRSLAKRPELTKARREAGRPNYDSQDARGLTASAAFPGPQRRLPETARTGSASTRAALFPGTSGPGLERPATPSWVPGAGQRGVPTSQLPGPAVGQPSWERRPYLFLPMVDGLAGYFCPEAQGRSQSPLDGPHVPRPGAQAAGALSLLAPRLLDGQSALPRPGLQPWNPGFRPCCGLAQGPREETGPVLIIPNATPMQGLTRNAESRPQKAASSHRS